MLITAGPRGTSKHCSHHVLFGCQVAGNKMHAASNLTGGQAGMSTHHHHQGVVT